MAESSASSGATKRLQIRKYPNRRYYDTTRSRHVTLEEIYALIRDGYEVQVTDSKTGHDITHKVLAQIIIELDEPKLGVFPVPMLHRLLRANREIVNEFVEKYFNQPLTAYLDSQRNMEQVFRQAMGIQNPAPTMADWAKMMWGPFSPAFWSGGGARPNGTVAPEHSSAGSEAAEADNQTLRNQVDSLRQQVADLQRELGAGGGASKRADNTNGAGAGGNVGRASRIGKRRKNAAKRRG